MAAVGAVWLLPELPQHRLLMLSNGAVVSAENSNEPHRSVRVVCCFHFSRKNLTSSYKITKVFGKMRETSEFQEAYEV
jgi:hypothetical protein